MLEAIDRRSIRRRIRGRIRKRIAGTPTRPRLAVFRSAKHIYAQAIDDDTGRTVAHASTLDPEVRSQVSRGGDVEAAKIVGTTVAKRLAAAGIESVVFDRGGFRYHGRVRALSEGARSGGLKF